MTNKQIKAKFLEELTKRKAEGFIFQTMVYYIKAPNGPYGCAIGAMLNRPINYQRGTAEADCAATFKIPEAKIRAIEAGFCAWSDNNTIDAKANHLDLYRFGKKLAKMFLPS